jgi:NAD:arginine ADP-ribosyltransferase
MKAGLTVLLFVSFHAFAQEMTTFFSDRPGANAGKTLQQVYAMPEAELESCVMEQISAECAGLLLAESGNPFGLTPAHKCAVQIYTNSGYFVNRGLWASGPGGETLNGDEWAYVRVLDAALKKITPKTYRTLYRGASSDEFTFTKKGDIVRLKGYASASTSQDVAEGFIKDRLLIIQNVKSGRDLKRFSNAGMEDEILLPRSTRVTLLSSEIKDMEIFTEQFGPQIRRVEVVTVSEAL